MIYGIVTADNTRIKIGTATSPHQRLKELQTGSHTRLKLVAVLKGGHDIETKLHREFSNYRTQGEWFVNNATISQLLVANSTIDFLRNPLNEIIRAHPALKSLWFDALITRARDKTYNKYAHFSQFFKPRVSFLVGWDAGERHTFEEKNEEDPPLYHVDELDERTRVERVFLVYKNLKTSEAYDAVYDWIMDLLPEVE